MKKQTYLPISIALQVAKALDGTERKNLTMRPPTTTDVVTAQRTYGNTIEKDVLLYANLTDTTEAFILSLEFYDFKQVEAAFNCFLFPVSVHADKRVLLSPKVPEAAPSES